jgi:pimeloyl-ACP methyl ester carboxylesterase
MTAQTFVEVDGRRLEVVDLPGDTAVPTLVLLHEGLGSLRLWRSFPGALHKATNARTVVFSRYGHGRSDPPPKARSPTFMHEEAREVVPAVLAALEIERPILVGHSDGASIAIIYTAEHDDVAGLVLLAPHVFVEDVCIESIEAIRERFNSTDLPERMARHHDDPAVTFQGWCDVWLDPAFRDWNLESLLPAIAAPILLIQGRDDQYGTLEQLDRVERGVSGSTERVVVGGGHSPHLEDPEVVLEACVDFVRRLSGRRRDGG